MNKPMIRNLEILFVFIIAIVFWMLGKSCGDVVDTSAQKKIDSVVYQAESEKAVYRAAVDKLGAKVDSLTRYLTESGHDLVEANKRIRNAENRADIAVAMYEQAKLTTDTSNMISYCDDLASEYHNYKVQVNEGAKISDSVITMQKTVIGKQKEIINLQEAKITSGNKQLDFVAQEFSIQNKKLIKADKRKGNFWRGMGIGAAATLAAIIAITR